MTNALALSILNGRLDDATVIPYLESLCVAGFQGACLHPRDGLLVPYLSRSYWQRIDRTIELCVERGLAVWFYDEFPFPSGLAGGVIPQLYPAARVRKLHFTEITAVLNEDGLIDLGPGALLALLRYRGSEDGSMHDINDVTAEAGPHFDTWVWGEWHNRNYTAAHHVRDELHERAAAQRFTWVYQPGAPLHNERLLAVWLVTPPGIKGLPGMPDVTLPEVTDLFLDKVYSGFADLAKKHSLQDVPVFQDEVSFYCELPWNDEIEKRLRALWGDSLRVKLCALYRPETDGWEQTRYEYRRACHEAIRDNWFKRVADYCHANDLLMTGHLPGEESIVGHWQLMGNAMENLGLFDIPGYDLISSPTADDINRCQATGAKLVQSTAWIAGRKPQMAEVFAAHGFHHDLQRARTELAWLALHDMTCVTDHTSWMSSLGARKYDAPPVNTRFNPLAVGHPDLWQWHRWFCEMMETYSFAPTTLVLFPAESFARYCMSEKEFWREETSLLETFFHYLCARSLDLIFLPTDKLDEVEIVEGGFHFQGTCFTQFVVPPVASMYEETWEQLQRFTTHPGFVWVSAQAETDPESSLLTIPIFGPNSELNECREIPADCAQILSEAELLERKSLSWSPVLSAPLDAFRGDVSIIKSLRRNPKNRDDALLTLVNPNETEVEVSCSRWPGEPVAQPPNGTPIVPEYRDGIYSLILPPRAIGLFKQSAQDLEKHPPSPVQPPVKLPHKSVSLRFEAANHWRLKGGTALLEDRPPVPFMARPVSALWKLDIPYATAAKAAYAPDYSLEPLAAPQHFEVSFDIVFEESLCDLSVVIDRDSLPPDAQVWWDQVRLESHLQDIYTQGNSVFTVAPEHLAMGDHRLRIRGTVAKGSDGLLERPILTGRFLVDSAEPPRLRAMPHGDKQCIFPHLWPDHGMPEGYGPLLYRFQYHLSEADATHRWSLKLPPCIGVAEVEVNGHDAGRVCWEPRVLSLSGQLVPGKNSIDIRLRGSWNNVFSDLNTVVNGLSRAVELTEDGTCLVL